MVYLQELLYWVAPLFPDAVFYKETRQKMIALTIDDVPTPNEPDDASVQVILNAIASQNQFIANPDDYIQATFFIISSHLGEEPQILARIQEQGHEIGNHGVVDEMIALLPIEEFENQFHQAHKQLTKYVHHPIRWYRPGRAFYTQEMVKVLRKMDGYIPKFALASMVPLDTFKPTDEPKFTNWYASQFIFPGAILIFHGGTLARSRQTAVALTAILAQARRLGYRIVTLSQLWDSV